ncbi:MAG: DUF2905 domain-containing protein [Nitrospirae bacterium]|nr:DUF2905 domain-containing protein [Candidatus Troglogloeales bacterium]
MKEVVLLEIGRILIFVGLLLFVMGVVLLLMDKIPGWGLGRLPGDILIERENFKLYFPFATSLLVSAFLSFLFWLLGKG